MNAAPIILNNAGRVVAGPGSLDQLAALATEYGARHVLVVTSRSIRNAGLLDAPLAALKAAGITASVLGDTPPEPDVADTEKILAEAQEACRGGPAGLVVGIGGGSAMDVAKIIAVLLAHPALTLRDLLAGRAKVSARGLPNIMVPTTAGTGSEATPNSIILVAEDELKVGIVSPKLLPDAVILDPLLTLSLPPDVTASTGMDALTHAIECYCSKKGNVFSDLYGLEAIRLIARSIRAAFHEPGNVAARGDMLLASFYGGVCIATSSTTAVHALAYPLGGKYRVAHGLSNAMLLPTVMAFNLVGNETRFAAMAQALGLPVAHDTPAQAGARFVDALQALNSDLGIPSDLKTLGITPGDLDGLVDGAAKVTRLLDNNPRPMGRDDMRAIYQCLM